VSGSSDATRRAYYNLVVYGPDDQVLRLRYLAAWLSECEPVWVGDAPQQNDALDAMREVARGMGRGYRFRANELDYDAAGAPRGWREP
jgi:hypothetical protein